MVRTASPFSSRRERRERLAGVPSPATIRPLVERLARLDGGAHLVVSCYLKLEPRDRARGKYAIKLKNRLREWLDWLAQRKLSRSVREAAARDVERVRRLLEDPANLPPGRGVAIFACEALELFEVIPLPQVFRSRVALDRTPLVRELAALDDEFGRVLCAVYDRTGARFFDVTAFGVEELPALPAPEPTRAARFHGTAAVARPGPGVAAMGEYRFNHRIRAEKQRHYAQIAQRLFELTQADRVRGVVLAATGAEAGAVRAHLHPYVAKLVLGTARLNPKNASPADVLEAVLRARQQSERAWEAEHVAALEEGVGTGWARNGVEATLRALARGQVRTLLVDAQYAQPGFRCRDSGRLTVNPEGCRGEGDAEPVPDVVDEAIEEALRQHAQVDVVEDETARRHVDGLAALLRFR
jgi:peptide chain release factor subunit 1